MSEIRTKPDAPVRIQILTDAVIDQIAAGEVVDRPGHMIKELCENSLDAGATELTVDFRNGGREVSIVDNGRGIRAEELPLALARHATSKIRSSDDLWQIASYGFRGEALASIGAVSRLEIISRPRDAETAAAIVCDFGSLSPVREAGGDFGTTVHVRDLFQNVPARLKFLKTDAGEGLAIKTQLKALAMANPHVSLRVLHQDELLFFWPAVDSFEARVRQVLELPELFSGEATLDRYRADVVVSSPNVTAKTSRQIWLFVRGRHVQDRSLQAAVTEAYRNLLMHGEFPHAVVNLDCDPEDLDVNVSPTKSQVKFREASQAFRVVQRAVRGVLERAPWLAAVLGSASATTPTWVTETPSGGSALDVRHDFALTSPAPPTVEPASLRFEAPEFVRVQSRLKELTPQPVREGHFQSQRVWNEPTETTRWAQLEVLGQSHLTYILAQKDDAILFIDQHAAHERVLFERLMKDYSEGRGEVQSFLLPPVVKLAEDALAEIMKNKSELEKTGLAFDQIGPDEIAVQAAPALVKPEALPPLFEKLGHEFSERGGSFAVEKLIGDLIATMACHSAVRAGQALSVTESRALLAQMDEFPLSSFCPHGRPVYVEYPLRKLERDFGRIV